MLTWMLLLALQWGAVFATDTYAWITTLFWTVIAVRQMWHASKPTAG